MVNENDKKVNIQIGDQIECTQNEGITRETMNLDNVGVYNMSPIVTLKRVLGRLSRSDLAAGLSSRLYRIERKLLADLGETVQGGPFAGMSYTRLVTTGGCIVPKLLGCYEQELHPAIKAVLECKFDAIINIGCAEGYYAIGMARAMPTTIVYAYDIDELARNRCQALAHSNGVADRVKIGQTISPDGFNTYTDQRVLVICDIEGGEFALLDPIKSPVLLEFDFLVELHPVGVDSIENFTDRYSATHEVEVIQSGERNPEEFPELASLSPLDKLLAMYERFDATPWVYLRSRYT